MTQSDPNSVSTITCPECAQQIAATSVTCPQCGFPIVESATKLAPWRSTLSRLDKLVTTTAKEIRMIAVATTGQISHGFACARRYWSVRRRRKDLATAQSRFGQWLWKHNLGDSTLRDSVVELDTKIDATRQAQGATRQLQRERSDLMKRLSATHVPQPSQPGYNEFQAMEQACQALADDESQFIMSKREIDAPDGATRRRVRIGFGLLGGSLCLILVTATIVLLTAGDDTARGEGGPSVANDTSADPAPQRRRADVVREIPKFSEKVPVLVVNQVQSRDGSAAGPATGDSQGVSWQGRHMSIGMEFERQNTQTPFRLSIAEENPGSSGAMLESSLWLAATVAALKRSDDLSGVRVEFSIQDDVDGPSAGGVVCLALLSALDGKRLPDDFAFTGSILPDGTIGRVGGMVQKIKAAKEKGATRVLVPAGFRFEEDENTGELVDLKQLATSLNLQFLVIRNIEQAYYSVHRQPPPVAVRIPADFAELPTAVEKVLIQDVTSRLAAGDAIWNGLSEEEQNEMQADPLFAEWIAARWQGQQAYRSGNFCYARDQVDEWASLMQAREDNKGFFVRATNTKGLLGFLGVDPAKDPQRFFSVLDGKIASAFNESPQPDAIVSELSTRLPPVASQFCVDVQQFHSRIELVAHVDAAIIDEVQRISEAKEEELPEGVTRQELMFTTALKGKAAELLIAHAAKRYQHAYADDVRALSKEIKPLPLERDRAANAERFFFTAYRSAHTTFESAVIEPYAEELSLTKAQTQRVLAAADDLMLFHAPLFNEADQSHRRLLRMNDNDPGKDFIAALNAQMFAIYLADVSGLIVRWSELDLEEQDDGSFTYGRLGALSHMLLEARRNAAMNIAQCKQNGIPCPAAIWWFQTAEATRDDNTVDKVAVLANYWRASLQAQALQMLFLGKE